MTIHVFFWNVVLVAGFVFVTFLGNVVRSVCQGPLMQRHRLTSHKTWTL